MAKVAFQEAAINQWLASQKEAMLALLRDTVNIASGSYDKAGVDAVGARFVRFFEEHGLNPAIETSEHFGDVIYIPLDDQWMTS